MLLSIGTALWLGILTSISPCPLATNIAAISFIGNKVENTRRVLLAGMLYTLGRMIAYVVVGAIVVTGILSIPGVANFLQDYFNRFLGPVLIVVGVMLLGVIPAHWFSSLGSGKLQDKAGDMGIWGAGLLGIVFALSFCPVSAALFFGSLIPLAVGIGSTILYPSIFGIGTGLPVIFFAILLAFSANAVGRAYDKLKVFELWARRITSVVFILAGIYCTIIYTFGVML
ncbi:MAG: sulfite exporter TauE/SafE family protein [Calditrichaeota bacterium]|nr:sulfite exporter TauE/SafE family protein [Calditrichota bacterium]MBT7788491.1 sulfite exporter TauE/SafE family protein [Calditrichota bacterium]